MWRVDPLDAPGSTLLEAVASPRGEAFASQLGLSHEQLMKNARRALGKKGDTRIACHMLLHGSYEHASTHSLEAQRGALTVLAGEGLGVEEVVVVAFFLSLSSLCRSIE